MTIFCIECGKEFHLTEGEVDYFISHKLILPKRCKECRDLRSMGIRGLKKDSYYDNIKVFNYFPIEGGTCNYSTEYILCVEDKDKKKYVIAGEKSFALTSEKNKATRLNEEQKNHLISRIKRTFVKKNINADVYSEGTQYMGHYDTFGIYES